MTCRSSTTPLPVLAADRLTRQNARARAEEQGLWLTELRTHLDGDSGGLWAHVSVESYRARRDDTLAPHDVFVTVRGADTTVECDCESGVLGRRPCTHAALALEHLSAWPFALLAPDETVYATLATPPTPEVWRCPKCGAPYESRGQLTNHRMVAHDNPPNPNRRVVERPTAAYGAALLARGRS